MNTLEYPHQSIPDHMLVGMASGKRINLMDVKESVIELSDIIFNMSRSPRYNAATLTENIIPTTHHLRLCKAIYREMVADGYADYDATFEAQLWFHDSPEAIVQDIISPLKRRLRNSGQLALYSEITDRLERAIYSKIGIKVPTEDEHKAIKNIDLYSMAIEQIMHRPLYKDEYSSGLDKQYPEYTYELMQRETIKSFYLVETSQCEWEMAVADLRDIVVNLPQKHSLTQQVLNMKNLYTEILPSHIAVNMMKMNDTGSDILVQYPTS